MSISNHDYTVQYAQTLSLTSISSMHFIHFCRKSITYPSLKSAPYIAQEKNRSGYLCISYSSKFSNLSACPLQYQEQHEYSQPSHRLDYIFPIVLMILLVKQKQIKTIYQNFIFHTGISLV